jgi:lipoprotein-releasing system permease protein
MNLSLYLTNRIVFNQQKGFSRFIIIISLIATILSLATMIVASSMVKGFRYEIANKIYGFWGHIEIRSFETYNGYDDEPIEQDNQLLNDIASIHHVKHIASFALKPCILKTENEIESLVLKGVDERSNQAFSFTILDGEYITSADSSAINKIVLSQITANRLHLKTGDKIAVYFAAQINGNTQLLIRNCVISGIYKSGLSDFDKTYALCSLHFLQKINKWSNDRITGYEIILKPGTNEQVIKDVAEEIHKNKLSSFLSAKPLSELYPNLFDWLELQKMNEFIIVLLMTIVAMVNLITMLLILILERSKFIGILKTIGARTIVITKIFVYQSAYIVAVGILIGNILGIGICLLQKYFHIITLDEETYFVSYAPIYFDWLYIIFISILVFAIAMLTLLLPTFLISSIKPSKVLRFS